MKKIIKLLLAFLLIPFLLYLVLPSIVFPPPPPDSVQSMEEADTETPLRRAYFTDYTRDQVIEHYKFHFKIPMFGTNTFLLRLNYPPEESQTLIRDQARSTYLEELVIPFRESLFINGFEPRVAKDDIWYKGRHFQQKITIRYVPSNRFIRTIIGVFTFISIWLLISEILKFLKRK